MQNSSDFWEVIHRVNPRIPIPTVHFIDTWTDIALGADGIDTLIGARAARDLIHYRERRLKRALAGGNAIIALKCCLLSNRFEDFWARRARPETDLIEDSLSDGNAQSTGIKPKSRPLKAA